MASLEKRVLDYVHEMRMISAGDRVGIAVSGGADSTALLRILHVAREKLGVGLIVLHFDHCLRGPESDADAEFVADLGRRYGLKFVLDREDVAAKAKANKWNLEDAARRLRYAFFDRVVHDRQADRIAVAHTADDQAETVLAHLLRGTGPTGLAGIYPVAGDVVRPLLCVRRQELRDYLREHGESWREDSTNADIQRTRARIRQRVVPLLEREFSPRIVERLSELARLSREQESFCNALTEDRFRCLVRRQEPCLSIRARDLIAPVRLPDVPELGQSRRASPNEPEPRLVAMTERLIRRIYQELHGSRQGLSAHHVDQVIRLAVASAGGRRAELPGAVIAEKIFGELKFWRETEPRTTRGRARDHVNSRAYAYPIKLPEQGSAIVSVPELQSRFRLKVIDWTCPERETTYGRSALDAALLRMPLILRNWRPGDAYRPRGRRQIHKVKHMFAEGRVPARDRASWPVLESAGQVVWAQGMAPAADVCATERTASGVVIEEERF